MEEGVGKMNFSKKVWGIPVWVLAFVSIGVISAVGYAAVVQYVLNVPSTVVVVKADPSVELVAPDNTTIVTSFAFGSIIQGETGTWSGYLRNTGNVDLHTFSISSPDIGSVGTVTWDMPVSGELGVGKMHAVTITLAINQTASVGAHSFTVQITGSPTISGPTSIVITASDPSDPWLRTWDITIDRPMPPMGPGGYHHGADFIEAHASGDTMMINWTFSTGAHYLVFDVTQTGGPSYGTYSGTITINGQAYSFSGIDGNNLATIDFTI